MLQDRSTILKIKSYMIGIVIGVMSAYSNTHSATASQSPSVSV